MGCGYALSMTLKAYRPEGEYRSRPEAVFAGRTTDELS
jgi:hypothetical protein